MPDYVEIDEIRQSFAFSKLIPSQSDEVYKTEAFCIKIPKNSLFDTLYLESKKNFMGININNPYIPVFENYEVSLYALETKSNKQKYAAYLFGQSFQKSRWQNDTIIFETKELGNFQIKADLSPPVIQIASKSSQNLSFIIRDDLSGIGTFKATINGKFLLMDYEYKSNLLKAKPLNPKEILKGDLRLEVRDKVGNINNIHFIL